MTARQRTIARPVEAEGWGLHTGRPVRVAFHPAPEGTGARFRRVDLDGEPEIPATTDDVRSVDWETSLGLGEAAVRTVEHVLAAVHGLAIDNVRIDVDGPEPPASDGSAAEWCDLLSAAGIVEQEAAARRLTIASPLHLELGSTVYTVVPAPGLRISAGIDFDHVAIGRQFLGVGIDPATFATAVAPARTFGLAAWEPALRERGLALGAGPQNTLVLGEDGLEDGCELRYPDEFVRHKILDVVGDLALVGARLDCHVIAERPGHRGNVALAKQLRERLEGEGDPGLDIERILEFLPHRYPMLLIDRILQRDGNERIIGLKNVTINEPFFMGHFPRHPVMPGVLIVEALAQCGGLLLMNEVERPEDKVMYFMSMDGVKFRKPVVPGDQLRLELELLQRRGPVCRLKGVARVEGKVVAEATMTAQIVDR